MNAALPPSELGRALGAVLEVVEGDRRWRPTMTTASRREGFAPRWGHARCSQVGLRAGSVVTMRLVDGVLPDPAKVSAVQRDGIGERTAEGFGRVLVDPPELRTEHPAVERTGSTLPVRRATGTTVAQAAGTGATVSGLPDEVPDEVPDELPDEVRPDQPHPLELAAWRREIRRLAAAIAMDPDHRAAAIPGLEKVSRSDKASRSQLGVLRTQLERLRLVTAPETVWQTLQLTAEQHDRLTLAPDREDMIKQHLPREAVAVLVDELIRQVRAEQEIAMVHEGVPS